jgi:O-Antigen ligase
MMAMLLLLVVLCAVLPARYIVPSLPALWIFQNKILGPEGILFNAGTAHFYLVDFVLLALLLKLVVSVVSTRQFPVDKPLYAAVAIYLAVNFLATLAAGAKFGNAQLIPCMTSLARFVGEVLIVPIMAQAVTTIPQAKRCIGIVIATLGVLAAIQFINFFGESHGFVIGEVQGIEREAARYFGPMGDSVGVVLLLGFVVSLCFANVPGVVSFLVGIVLTAGLGAIFAAGVGTVLFLIFGRQTTTVRAFAQHGPWLLPMAAFLAILFEVTRSSPFAPTLLQRVSEGNFGSSGSQRIASATIAGAMIVDNPLFGVGYMGYQPALDRYGGDEFFDLAHLDGGTANANNQFLQVLTDGGVAGLPTFLLLVFCAARLLRKIATQSDDRFLSTFYLAAFIWLLAQVFGNLSAVWLAPSCYVARFLWILLGVGIAVQRLLPAAIAQQSLNARPMARQTPLVPV